MKIRGQYGATQERSQGRKCDAYDSGHGNNIMNDIKGNKDSSMLVLITIGENKVK